MLLLINLYNYHYIMYMKDFFLFALNGGGLALKPILEKLDDIKEKLNILNNL